MASQLAIQCVQRIAWAARCGAGPIRPGQYITYIMGCQVLYRAHGFRAIDLEEAMLIMGWQVRQGPMALQQSMRNVNQGLPLVAGAGPIPVQYSMGCIGPSWAAWCSCRVHPWAIRNLPISWAAMGSAGPMHV